MGVPLLSLEKNLPVQSSVETDEDWWWGGAGIGGCGYIRGLCLCRFPLMVVGNIGVGAGRDSPSFPLDVYLDFICNTLLQDIVFTVVVRSVS